MGNSMDTTIRDAARLSVATGAQVDPVPFDVGYWKRINGEPRPSSKYERYGWDEADEELRGEEKTKRRVAKS